MIRVVAVVAVADNGVIGRDNALPWRQRSDLKHFRALTIGRPIIMGRRTLESIGKPLPGRPNIVLSRSLPAGEGFEVVSTPEAALARGHELADLLGVEEVMVTGGGEVYRALMPFTDVVELTEIHVSPDGHTKFPDLDPAGWRETARADHPANPPEDEHDYSFVRFERIIASASHS